MATLQVLEPGLLDYSSALELQEQLLAARQQNIIPDTLMLLEHPPVITIGRSGRRHNILVSEERLNDEGIGVYEVNRGGDVTYHGPGQLVGYPIINLANHGKDVHAYYTRLEQVFIDVLRDYGLNARRDANYPGVWVEDKKIVAIGVAVKKWVTMHGFALNISPNLRHFDLINPCGIAHRGVTSMQECYSGDINPVQVRHQVINAFGNAFGLKPVYTSMKGCN